MIHAIVNNDPALEEWFLSCVYGTLYVKDQPSQWNYIKNLRTSVSIPWALIGDLNVTMNLSDGNTSSPITSPEVLNHINQSDLHDINYIGNPFTWTSNSHGTGKFKSRIDRALVNSDFILKYPDATLTHLGQLGSDHVPIMLSLYSINMSKGRNWKFFEHWMQSDSCATEIMNAWSSDIT
ncbi:uncharacterized protein LOC113305521 [Papaver somniferum]|uniref:uncharacterized protein LOC113305521 n=1 Tax=Papaver somniferum TaxID=3469 RepID=UPI000E6F9DD6|nr:uncharacterized protein LOC113305521 [Papaver somniferum]